MLFHIEFDIAAIAIIFVCYVYTFLSYDSTKTSTKQYKHMLGVIFVAAFLDTLTSYTISVASSIPIWVNDVLNTLYYFFAILSGSTLPRYVRYLLPNPGKMAFIDKVNTGVLILSAFICLLNPFIHNLNYIDENYAYNHGPLYLIIYILPFYFIFLGSSRAVYFKKLLTRKQFSAILSFNTVVVVIMLLQLFVFDDYLLTYFGCSLGLFIILYSLETPDYSRLMKTMMDLEKAKEDALLANKAKSSFLASMSHEIRTPINGILGMNEIAINENSDPNIEEYLLNIQNAGQSLLSIINDILDFSKIESGKLEIHPHEFLLGDTLFSVNNLLTSKAAEKGLSFTIENNPRIPNTLFGDDTRIRQIMVNIINNGIKYTEKGSVSVFVDYEKKDDKLLELIIKVSDTGIGISKEDLPKLFNSYQRVDEEKNRNIEGTGLGLSITKQLTELMEGNISVDSTYGLGSTFTIKLPLTVIDATPIGTFAENNIAKRKYNNPLVNDFKAPDASILIVDDNELNRKVMLGLLKNTKIQMTTADSGPACINHCNAKKFDLIFLDHMMPLMNGIETLYHVKNDAESLNKETPIIVLTANAIVGAKEEYLQKGFTDFLAKPIDTSMLYEQLVKYLPKEKCMDKEDLPTEEEDLQLVSTVNRLQKVLDIESGINNCANQKKLYLDVVSHFAVETLDNDLNNCFFNLDWNTYGTISHGLKSSSRTIGAKDFSNFCKRMEDSCKDERVDIVIANHDKFIEEYKQLQNKIKKMLEE